MNSLRHSEYKCTPSGKQKQGDASLLLDSSILNYFLETLKIYSFIIFNHFTGDNMPNEEKLKNLLPDFSVTVLDTVDSTNSYLKRLCPKNRSLVVAKCQENGRGRQGKSFYSPKDTGIYMSLFLPIEPFSLLTPTVAVSVCDVLDKISENSAKIKWVNDIFVSGRKVSGILCEKTANGVIIGIGINLETDVFPDEIKNIAGSVFPNEKDKNKIISDIVESLLKNLENPDILKEYKSRLFFLGSEISFIKDGEKITATAVDVNGDGNLIVLKDGEKITLISGEISLGSENF